MFMCGSAESSYFQVPTPWIDRVLVHVTGPGISLIGGHPLYGSFERLDPAITQWDFNAQL